MNRFLGSVALFGTLCALGAAQVSQQGSGYLFRLHLTKGEKIHFKIPFTISGMEGMNLRFHMHLRVQKVTGSGEATVHCLVDTGGLHLPGIDQKGGSFVVDTRGRVADEAGNAPVGFCVMFPKDPILVGGTFVAPVPAAIGGGDASGKTQGTFKFLGFSGTGIHRVARLTFKVLGNKDPGGSILVRVSDGVIEKYYTRFNATPKETGTPVTVTATIIRM